MKLKFLNASLYLVVLFTVFLAQSSIDEFRWKYRLLIVDTSEADALQHWEKLYKKHVSSFEERNLIVLIRGFDGNLRGIPSPGDTELLSPDDLQIPGYSGDSEYVTLVGLDGGVKAVIPLKAFNIQGIFDRIDRMPMRASELRKRSQIREE